MLPRVLKKELLYMAKKMPVITITGPRQSGKTTLARATFKAYKYVTLENPDDREYALLDPKRFLEEYASPVIIDEVQNVPELLSYIQGIVDSSKKTGQYILTGSRQLAIAKEVSQSLAGRSAVFSLLPFSYEELKKRYKKISLNQIIFNGGYPRIYDKSIPANKWLSGYVKNYLERDIRSIINIGDLNSFQRFLRLCAARTGQILNMSSLAVDAGVTHTTVKRWISILEGTSIIFLLQPYYNNYSKRVVKSPKLYFYDTGLVCYLLRIREKESLDINYQRGSIFETFIVSEIYKRYINRGEDPPIFYWRDKSGHEIDLIIENDTLEVIEIKSSKTFKSDMVKNLIYFKGLVKRDIKLQLIYDGREYADRNDVKVVNWKSV